MKILSVRQFYLADMEVLVVLLLCLLSITTADQGGPPVIKEHPSSVVARRNDPATLNCAASGASRIRWFRDGEEVTTSPQDSRSHRVLLPSGSLFFLRVSSSKRDSDAGTYWCVASNSYGATRSNSATLTVATLADDFQVEPKSTAKVRIGDTIQLPCQPPKGSPLPELTWLRDGYQVTNSSRVSVSWSGELIITRAVEEDSAVYVCRAHNAAGTRDSQPSRLTVMIPPWFDERPTNVTVASGVVVELACRARGSPTPTVTWRRLDGKMPLGRAMIEDQQLVLDQVAAGDSGVYVCEVESEAGIATARATLTVVDAPQLAQRPQNVYLAAGNKARLSCRVEGDPEPLVLWRLPTQDRTGLLTPAATSGRASVSPDGHTLTLDQVTTDDTGSYYCWGVSSGGGVRTRAEVLVVTAQPPPVVGVGPKDLTMAPGATATFPCEAVSEAATPTITWWYRPAAHLPAHHLIEGAQDGRVTLPANGALVLKNIGVEDAGIYSCHVAADTGKVEQAAILRVVDGADKPGVTLLPAPPSKPRLLAVNETAVHLSWLPNSQVGGGSDQTYTVEYWRHGWEEWRRAHVRLTQGECVVDGLTPDFTYTFLVRAVDSNGASFPSPWSDPIITQSQETTTPNPDQLRQIRRKLSRPAITLKDATAVTSNSVLLTWEFINLTEESVEGVVVYSVSDTGSVQVATVLGTASYSHLVHDLYPNTRYTFFLLPFWRNLEGTPSNSQTLTTSQDVPLVAPGDVTVNPREEGSVLITWSTLAPEKARGTVVGYQVTLSYNNSHTTQTVTNPWLEANGLLPGRLYTVRVAALTEAGLGPFTAPVLMQSSAKIVGQEMKDDTPSVLYSPPQPAWLIYLLIPLVLLMSVATLFYVRHLRGKSANPNPPHSTNIYHDGSLYSAHHSINMYGEQKLWRPVDYERDFSTSSKKLIHQEYEYEEPRIQCVKEAEPYATTALLTSSPSSGYRSPWMHQSDDSGVQVNWSAFLPPPPTTPPPCDLDLGDRSRSRASDYQIRPDRRVYSKYDNMDNVSEQYERPCDFSSSRNCGLYSPVPQNDGCGKFPTFNTLQTLEYRKVRTEFRPVNLSDDPRSNTN